MSDKNSVTIFQNETFFKNDGIEMIDETERSQEKQNTILILYLTTDSDC